MSGLEIAAGAASVVSLCDLVVCKLLPFLQSSANTDKTIRRFHRDICDFKDILVIVEDNFGAKSDLQRQPPIDRSKHAALKLHVEECKRTIEEIKGKLPEPEDGNRNYAQQLLTNLHMTLTSNPLSKLRQDIPALKATLQLWLQVVQV